MSEDTGTLTIAKAMIEVGLDTSKYKQQLKELQGDIGRMNSGGGSGGKGSSGSGGKGSSGSGGKGSSGSAAQGAMVGSALGDLALLSAMRDGKGGAGEISPFLPKLAKKPTLVTKDVLGFGNVGSGLEGLGKNGWGGLGSNIEKMQAAKENEFTAKVVAEKRKIYYENQKIIAQNAKIIEFNKNIAQHQKNQDNLIKATSKLEYLRYQNLERFGALMKYVAVAGVGTLTYSWMKFLKTSDPAAIQLNSAVNRLKASFFQLGANVMKVADAKWGITAKIEKFASIIRSLSKADISAFLDNVKLAVFLAGFTKLLTVSLKIAEAFMAMATAQKALATAKLAAGASTAVSSFGGVEQAAGGAVAARGLGGMSMSGGLWTAAAMLATGVALRELGGSGDTATSTMLGLNKAISFLSKTMFTAIEIAHAGVKFLGDMSMSNSGMDNLDEAYKNLKNIWKDSKEAQDKMGVFGDSATVGIADLNKSFQETYNQNAMLEINKAQLSEAEKQTGLLQDIRNLLPNMPNGQPRPKGSANVFSSGSFMPAFDGGIAF